MQMDALRAAHKAPLWPHQDVITGLQSQVDSQHAELRWVKRQLAEANAALADAERSHAAEVSAREHLARDLHAQLQSLEADNTQLRASSSGEATRAAAERARAEAAAHVAAAEARQLKAVLAAQSADLEKYHRQCAREAKRHAAAAAEIHELRESCARKDAALKSANAAAHQAATAVAKLMQRDAEMDDNADQQPSYAGSQDPDLSSATGGLSSEDTLEEQTDSEGHAEHGEATCDQHQLQQAGGKACVEYAQLGSQTAMDIDKVAESSPQATREGMASMQIVPDHGASPPACLNRLEQSQQGRSSPTASETSKHAAICPHDQHGFGPTPLTGEYSAESGQLENKTSYSREKGGSKRYRHADRFIMPGAHGERHRSRGPARRPSPSRHRSWDRSASVLQRSHSPSDRRHRGPSDSPKGQHTCSPCKDRHSRHKSGSRSARQAPHEDSRRHRRQGPTEYQRSNISKDVGKGALPSWESGQFAGLGQHRDSMLGNSFSMEPVSASTHAALSAKQELAERGTGWLLAGETHKAAVKNTLMADPTKLGYTPPRSQDMLTCFWRPYSICSLSHSNMPMGSCM